MSVHHKAIVETERKAPGRQAGGLAILLIVVALGGTLFLYREAPRLPFFFDDMIHLRWLDWHTLPSIWATGEGLGYYRPLTMSFWKVGHLLLGYNDPVVFHLLNLALHALNGVLAGALAWRAYHSRGRGVYACLVTLIFVSFPFSYQAVPSTSSLSKPLIATLALVTVLLYWEGRRRGARWLLVVSLLTALLAPFAYELGVMVPLAVLATELLAYSRREFDRFSPWPFLYMALVWLVALPIVVLLEPETGASVSLPELADLWYNGTFFAQGLVFPLAPLATPLERLLAVDRYVLLALIDLLGFAALLAFYRWARQLALFWYALAWFAVGILPLWLQLDFAYVITSPRILYLATVGCSMIWAGIPVFLWTHLPARWWPRVLAAAGVVGLLAFNGAYVRQKMVLAEEVAAPLWQAVDAAAVEGSAISLLYLNVPAWVAPKEPVYRVGTEGLTFIPEYVRVQDFVYVNGRVEPEIEAAIFEPTQKEWRAYVGYAGTGLSWDELTQQIRRVDGVYLTTYPDGGLRFVEAGGLEPAVTPVGSGAAEARFGDQIALLKDQVEVSGDQLLIKLWWQCLSTPQQDVTVLLHVYDASGQLVTQADGYPLAGLFPAQRWQPGDVVRDVRRVSLPPELAGGVYTVAVGWYDAASGLRLPAVDAQGQPVPDDALRIFQP